MSSLQKGPSLRYEAEQIMLAAQEAVCHGFSDIEAEPFHETTWERPGGGGGRSRVVESGKVFEKAGVNFSSVHGKLPPEAAASMLGGKLPPGTNQQFFATGVSIVMHPHNPFAPTAHANFRFFEVVSDDTEIVRWVGGGADLTPCYLFEDDVCHFHQELKAFCDKANPSYYSRFKAWCDEYFVIRHRNECRGVGGIFFDGLRDRPAAESLDWFRGAADAFLKAYRPIVERRHALPFEQYHREWQELRRGRYVEFNLVYDRGTIFGLKTGGRVESILMSLPRVARWHYDHKPAPDSEEQKLMDVLRHPRAWLDE